VVLFKIREKKAIFFEVKKSHTPHTPPHTTRKKCVLSWCGVGGVFVYALCRDTALDVSHWICSRFAQNRTEFGTKER
jgi:hypothetical protein